MGAYSPDLISAQPMSLLGFGLGDDSEAADRAHKHARGSEPSGLNPFNPFRLLDTVQVSGPSTISIRFGDPTDLFDTDTEELVLAYDDARILERATTIVEGGELVHDIEDPKADVLEIYATDTLPVDVKIVPLSRGQELHDEKKRREEAEAGAKTAFDKFLDALRDLNTKVANRGLLLVVGGAAIAGFYWWYKSR